VVLSGLKAKSVKVQQSAFTFLARGEIWSLKMIEK